MYIIYSERARKALKVWSHLATTTEHTALVEGIRAGMAHEPR